MQECRLRSHATGLPRNLLARQALRCRKVTLFSDEACEPARFVRNASSSPRPVSIDWQNFFPLSQVSTFLSRRRGPLHYLEHGPRMHFSVAVLGSAETKAISTAPAQGGTDECKSARAPMREYVRVDFDQEVQKLGRPEDALRRAFTTFSPDESGFKSRQSASRPADLQPSCEMRRYCLQAWVSR